MKTKAERGVAKAAARSSGRDYAAAHRSAKGAAGTHDAGEARRRALEKLLTSKEKDGGSEQPDVLRCRAQLADSYLSIGKWERASELLSVALELDPSDGVLGARRYLAPLYLRLGRRARLNALVARFSSDQSTAMCCTIVLERTAAWLDGSGSEAALRSAFQRAYSLNWYAMVLLCAWRTTASLPVAILSEARREGAPPGGIEEAIAWVGRHFSEWAADSDDEGEGGAADADEGDKVPRGDGRRAEGQGNKSGWPGLESASAWLCAMLLQQPPPEAAVGMVGDGRRFVRCFNDNLDKALEEVQQRVTGAVSSEDGSGSGEEAASDSGESEEGGEEAEEEGTEEGEEEGEEDAAGDDEAATQVEEVRAGSARAMQATAAVLSSKRDRTAFEAWRDAKRIELRAKLARAHERAAHGGTAEVSDAEDDSSEAGSASDDSDRRTPRPSLLGMDAPRRAQSYSRTSWRRLLNRGRSLPIAL